MASSAAHPLLSRWSKHLGQEAAEHPVLHCGHLRERPCDPGLLTQVTLLVVLRKTQSLVSKIWVVWFQSGSPVPKIIQDRPYEVIDTVLGTGAQCMLTLLSLLLLFPLVHCSPL